MMKDRTPYKTLPLGKSDQVALVDAEDYLRVRRWSWSASGGHVWRHRFPLYSGGAKRYGKIMLAREVLGLSRGVHVRYINGNRLDCRKANLEARTCTICPSRSKRNPYRVQISIDVRAYHCGLWPTEYLAKQAQEAAMRVAVTLRGKGYSRGRIQRELDLATGRRVESKYVRVQVQQERARAA
jgi:hypothetical protein